MRRSALIQDLLQRRLLTLVAGLMMMTLLNAQLREIQFDDSDMALDLTDAFTFQKYPTYSQYVEMMQYYASQYPEICRLDTFGTSVEGRMLLALKISDYVKEDEPEANFLYSSSMHGDEIVGIVLMLRLIDHLLKGYGNDNEVTGLVDSLAIWINPMANPDGSYSADNNLSLENSTRLTVRDFDLNRNFPDPGVPEADDTTGRALENQYMMQFLRDHGFTLSANIHSGTEVVNYPWDFTYALHADDDWYRFISREYADEAMAVNPDYMFGWPDDGITNGAEWYIVHGSRQDYVNYYLEGREVTLELSADFRLASIYLEEHWNINRRSLLNYMAQCMYGIRGWITDMENGDPVEAQIQIPGHDGDHSVVHSSADHGDFYRLIKEGVYDLVISAPGYLNDTIMAVSVTDYAATYLNIQLTRDPKIVSSYPAEAPEFRLYPNPASQVLYIVPDHVQPGEVNLKIISPDGRIVFNTMLPITGDPTELQVQHLKNGVYFFQFTSKQFTGTYRILIHQ